MKKKIPCNCIKGGYTIDPNGNERVCSKCNGNEWIDAPDIQELEQKEK